MLGGIIALGAIGLTLCYGVLKFPNFAHGALVRIGAYAAFALVSLFPQGPPLRPFSFGWALIASMFLAAPVAAIVALVVTRVLFLTLRRRSEARRVGNVCASTCRSRWGPLNEKTNKKT